MDQSASFVSRWLRGFGACCLIGILALGWAGPILADDGSVPDVSGELLQPVDTSSPRATLQGYLDAMNRCYELGYKNVQRYLASSRLFPTPEEMATIGGAQHRLMAAERALDLSGLPPATLPQSARRVTIQLKEILDRIDLPPFETVPDAQAMAGAEFKRWAVPHTEIRIARIDAGPRAGEYLFSAETVSRIPDFYEKVRHLPYKPGASEGLYGLVVYSPAAIATLLEKVVPARWLLDLPSWALTPLFDQPLWRWAGIFLVLGAGFLVVRYFHRLRHRWKRRETASARWAGLLRPLSIVIVAPLAALILDDLLRVSGVVGKGLTLSMWTLYSLALTWLVWVVGTALAESVIASERLRASSIDSQLIRLAVRLLTIVLAFAILIEGGNRIGLPAYSVVAGLGVGGLAVALAGQQTLANLLGSVIIMIEKPFKIGDCIKVGGMEGTVEDVGFRSTRIRTFYDSLVTIPSSQLVTSTIDNMELRRDREVKTLLNLTYDTPPDRIEAFVQGIRELLEAHPVVRKDNIQVAFNDFGPHSLDIHLKFFVRAPSRLAELADRERIFLNILRLADRQGVRFAFPTQTLHVESVPESRATSA